MDAPAALKAWSELVSRWSADLFGVSGPLDPPELEAGKLIFWADGSDSWEFGVSVSEDDPPVFAREVDSDWVPVQESLSEFLLHVTVLESAIGAADQCSARAVPVERLSGIVSGYRALPLPALPCPSMDVRIYVGPDSLLQISESVSDLTAPKGQLFDVSVSALVPASIDEVMERHPEIAWKRYSAAVAEGFSPDDLPEFLR
ncbi:hypothetical protein [Lentzea sp. NPDC051838]|uniref:hypothetical protein n=1 Tax=Lentzea sp. NPDC051838 TaxID=3154849 RepID=UPI003424A171